MITSRSRLAIAVLGVAVALQGFAGCGSDGGNGAAAAGAGTGSSGSAGRADLDAAAAGFGGSQSTVGPDAGSVPDAEMQGDSGPPPATDSGLSVYALECRGDSRDCAGASVPCFGLLGDGGPIGYACANRCQSVSDCSAAPSGAEAEVDCVQLSSARHCLLVCKFETQEFACPNGMGCYVYPGSPIGYCLWM